MENDSSEKMWADVFCESIEPIFHTDPDRTYFMVEFPVHPAFVEPLDQKDGMEVTMEVTPEVTPEVTMEVKRLLNAIIGEQSRKELQEMLKLKNAEHFRKAYLLPAIKAGVEEMTLPDKPKSRLQKYRLAQNGLTLKKLLRESTQSET